MIEPLTVIAACYTISKTIYSNVKRVTEVGETLHDISEDQRQLVETIDAFRAQIPPPRDDPSGAQWKILGESLTGLAAAMEQLDNVLNDIKRVELGGATRPAQAIRLQFQNGRIDDLKQKIEAYVRTIQLSAQFISL
jgi:hypothetical protein